MASLDGKARIGAALIAGVIGVVLAAPQVAQAQAVPVKIVQKDGAWQLLRGGKPYFIRGAGGSRNLDILQTAGGNSIRTWGAEGAARDLDTAQQQGMTVSLGIWLGHPEHGFKYDDPKAVAEQRDKAIEVARKYRDHSALLVWGIGNEMEAATGGKDENVWRAVEEIAKAIKKIDPNHPTMTVVAEIGENGIKAKNIARLCPSIDILGVNSYGGLSSLPTRLKAAGWTKPYIVTEFGPPGPWEVPKTRWGSAIEPTSTDKTRIYMANYQSGIASQPGWCLGSYSFLWGTKFEGTATWFGMLLPGGHERLGPVDAMTLAWTGKQPEARVPEIWQFQSSAAFAEVAPGSPQTVRLLASGGAGRLSVHYEVVPDKVGPSSPDPGQQTPDSVHAPTEATADGGEHPFTAPTVPGAYRVFVYVRDSKGGAATANLPFLVKGPTVSTTK